MSGFRSIRLDLPREWRTPARAPGASSELRESLGLDPQRPIIMAGHQPQAWHAGILAKRLVLDGADAGRAWVVVDQDSESAGRLRYPGLDAEGVPVAREWAFAPAPPEIPAGALTPADPIPAPPGDAASPAIAHAIDRFGAALSVGTRAPSLAMQVADAVESLLPASRPCTLIPATTLAATRAFQDLAHRMLVSPESCRRAYNDAAARHPEANIRPLDAEELPLWVIHAGAPRERAFAPALRAGTGSLAPRALTMTGVLRWAACDLFIHGTGGAIYDRVTEAWFRSWLDLPLAPAGLATATCLLDPSAFGTAGSTSDRDAAEARARANRARHDPRLAGDGAAADAKSAILAEIDRARREGRDPAPLFARMQAGLDDYRRRNADRLAAMDREADRLARLAGARGLADDRTWPFIFLDGPTVADLRGMIAQPPAPATP